MKRETLLLAVGLAAVAVCIVLAVYSVQMAEYQGDRIDMIAATTPAPNDVPARERVIQLPEDGQAYHTTVIVSANWRERRSERYLLGWFASHPGLASLKAQTHFHQYDTTDALYKTRLAHAVPDTPAVVVQQADGKVVYKASGVNLPQSADELAGNISISLGGCRPRPRPQPAPKPDVDVDVDVTPIPDIAPQPARPEFPWVLLIVAVLLGAALPLWVHFRSAFR